MQSVSCLLTPIPRQLVMACKAAHKHQGQQFLYHVCTHTLRSSLQQQYRCICLASVQPSRFFQLQGFTSFSSRSQAADVQSSGINPLMQTPAPAARGSVFVPPLAAAVQQDRTAQAVLRKTKISPKKLNEFARLIRRMHIDDALVQCQVAPNKAAKLCYKVLLPC